MVKNGLKQPAVYSQNVIEMYEERMKTTDNLSLHSAASLLSWKQFAKEGVLSNAPCL